MSSEKNENRLRPVCITLLTKVGAIFAFTRCDISGIMQVVTTNRIVRRSHYASILVVFVQYNLFYPFKNSCKAEPGEMFTARGFTPKKSLVRRCRSDGSQFLSSGIGMGLDFCHLV